MNTHDRELANRIIEGIDIEDNVSALLHCGPEAILYLLDFLAERVKYESPRHTDLREMCEYAGHGVHLLGWIYRDFLIELFEEQVNRTDNPPYLFWLTWMIGSMQDDRAVEPLIKCLAHADLYTRVNCCNSLKFLKNSKAIPALRKATLDDRYEVRCAAIKALKEFGVAIPENESFVANLTDAELCELVRRGERDEAIGRIIEKSGHVWTHNTAKAYLELIMQDDAKKRDEEGR